MCRRAEGRDGERNGASGAFPLPEAPATSMKSIPEHANIRREALAEEYDLLPLPILAVTPGALPAWCRSLAQEPAILAVPGERASLGLGSMQPGARPDCKQLEHAQGHSEILIGGPNALLAEGHRGRLLSTFLLRAMFGLPEAQAAHAVQS